MTIIPPAMLQSLSTKVAFLKGAAWPQRKKLRIGFFKEPLMYEGQYIDPEFTPKKAKWVQEVVTKYFEPLVNLTFEWDVPVKTADIRIMFVQSLGAWSTLGTQALARSPNEPTMNLGWLDEDATNSSNSQTQGKGTVVLHEWMHGVAGAIHEHSREDAKFNWNKDYVYAAMAQPPNSWSKEMVDFNVFQQYQKSTFNGSEYDKTSIMEYYFNPEYFSPPMQVPLNSVMSPLDKEFVSKLYPKDQSMKTIDTGKTPEDKKKMLILGISGLLIAFLLVMLLRKRKM